MITPAQRLANTNRSTARRRKLSAETRGTADCGEASVQRYRAGCRCDKCRVLAAKLRKKTGVG